MRKGEKGEEERRKERTGDGEEVRKEEVDQQEDEVAENVTDWVIRDEEEKKQESQDGSDLRQGGWVQSDHDGVGAE